MAAADEEGDEKRGSIYHKLEDRDAATCVEMHVERLNLALILEPK